MNIEGNGEMSKITPRDNPCYCINLRRAANTLTKFYDKAFASMNLTTNQFSLLNDIQQLQICNKSELAQYSRLDRTTIIRNLSVLREKGLIEDVIQAGSKNKVVRLTETGKSAITEGRIRWKQVQKRIDSILGGEKIKLLQQIFTDTETLDE